ncbi:MAG: hypothetical protein QGI09_07935, partial [Dehalococcoidia bacterium]|nr:hypothetical protein [Dehalococcoidia bacterium]
MKVSTESLARTSGKHPWWILLAWLLILAGAFVLSSTLVESALDGEGGPTQTLEYQKAQDLIDEKFGPLDAGESPPGDHSETAEERSTLTEFILITSESVSTSDPAFAENSRKFGERLDEVANSLLVGSFGDYEATTSPDGSTNLFRLQILKEQAKDIALLTDTA